MKIEWQKLLSRENVDLTTISGLDIVFYDSIWRYTKKREELFFTLLRDRNLTHYIGVSPIDVGRYLYRENFDQIGQIKDYYNKGEDLIGEIKQKSQYWQKKLSQKSFLLPAFLEFRRQFEFINYEYSIGPWLAIEAWQSDFESLLNKMIKKRKLEKKEGQITASIYKPWKKTALGEIQEKINGGEDLDKLTHDYQFLRSFAVVWYRPIDQAWLKSLIGDEQKEKQPELLTREEIISILKPNSKEKHFLELSPYIIFFKDYRDDLRRKQAFYWTFLFEEIGNKFGAAADDIGYLSLDEIEDRIKSNKLDLEVIERRKNNPVIATICGQKLKIDIIDKDIPAKYEEIINQIEKGKEKIEIKGLVAQQGIVKGRVKIIRTYHDIKDISDGEILVANTTHPNYLPAMKKAAAFITNEGGIISHAAIVAREMKKPCIVGTKVATQVLKDGDFIEVDAKRGIARKLK